MVSLRSITLVVGVLALISVLAPGMGACQEPIGNFQFERGEEMLRLARGGVAQAVIVMAEGAPAPVQFAADELQEHLGRMTGGDFEVVSEAPADGVAIVLGDTPAARAAGIDVSEIGRDGYAIRTVGSTIFIAGTDDASAKSEVLAKLKTEVFPPTASRYRMEAELGEATWDFERGTLYGVYRFLEELGVRWFFPGPKGNIAPAQPDLTMQAFSLQEEPHYQLRKVGRTTWQWYMLDSSRISEMVNREEYEELGWGGDVLRLWLLRVRHSSEWFAFNHRPTRLELEQRYGAEHPEYFALRENGERDLLPQTGRTGHLCYTEPGVVEITKRDIEDYYAGKTAEEIGLSAHRIALNPSNGGWPANAIYGRTVSLLPHDSFRGCECEDCLALTRKDAERPRWHSDLVWQFIGTMADWLQESYPDKLITCLAYSSYTERPEDLTTLPENVVVGLCPANYARTHNDVKEENYQDMMRIVQNWSSVNDRPMLIWLHHLYRYRAPRRQGVPMLLTGVLGRMFRDLAPHANLMHVELDSDSIMLEHLNRYVMLKLLYNPNLDPAELVEDYARSFYGPGGDIVLTMLRDVEVRSMKVGETSASSIETWEEYFTEEVVAGYREQADEVVRLTEGTDYAENARVFSKWFVGAIEEGRMLYVRNVKEVGETAEANVSIRALVGDITVDGALDEEGWQGSSVRNFISNLDGQKTQWPTEIRFLRAPEDLYFGFTCYDPNSATLPEGQGEADSVEIFLDPEHNHDNYYWLWIDLAGRIEDWYHEGGGEPADKTWESNAEVAIQKYEDRWVVEVRLPRASMAGGLIRPDGRPWGANFARSTNKPPRPEDQFSCWSPLLRGKFHQPDLFAHIFFVK